MHRGTIINYTAKAATGGTCVVIVSSQISVSSSVGMMMMMMMMMIIVRIDHINQRWELEVRLSTSGEHVLRGQRWSRHPPAEASDRAHLHP